MTIGVWGDSITFGACDSKGLGWPGRLRKELALDDYSHLYNFGICGETSEDLLKRFKIEAEAIKPSDIIFAIGINDSKYPGNDETNKVSLANYEKNLEDLINQAKNFTKGITIVGAIQVNDAWRSMSGSRFFNEEIQKYTAVMKDVADRHGLRFIDMSDVLDTTHDLADGLHPNAEGYQKMFEAIKTQVIFEA
ncbi:MAG: SGNH/GDSL hydrolase family protein [Candidatus Magasanikbacteria bacterium]|nr:SGNH/GDSL hydrolase family protein [Candidatus Magasanikbacteria bacterium]